MALQMSKLTFCTYYLQKLENTNRHCNPVQMLDSTHKIDGVFKQAAMPGEEGYQTQAA